MPGFQPQNLVHDFRRNHFLVAAIVDFPTDIILEGIDHLGSLRMPEHHSRRVVFDVVKVHFLADFPMVALGGFFQLLDIDFKAFLVGKAGSVNAGQLVAFLIAVPVSAGEGKNFETFEFSRTRHMGTRTQVFPIFSRFACNIKTQRAIRIFAGKGALRIVRLVFIAFGTLQAFFAADFDTSKRAIFLDDFLHAFFNFREILFFNRSRRHQIVIETFFDGGAIRQLCPRKQIADGFGEHMAAAVAQEH